MLKIGQKYFRSMFLKLLLYEKILGNIYYVKEYNYIYLKKKHLK